MNKILVSIAAAFVLAGCATNPVTGRKQFIMVSESEAIAASKQAYVAELAPLAKQGKIDNDPAMTRRVHEITDRLIAQAVRFRPEAAKWDWKVQVVDDPKTVNAFCMAGGKMGIYTGFWDKFHASDDEIAAVMGHEIGHALASHTREKMSVEHGARRSARRSPPRHRLARRPGHLQQQQRRHAEAPRRWP